MFCHGECLETAAEHEMFAHNLPNICVGSDMIRKSIHLTCDFQQAAKWLPLTAAVEIHVSWYGSLYSDGVLIMAIDRELSYER